MTAFDKVNSAVTRTAIDIINLKCAIKVNDNESSFFFIFDPKLCTFANRAIIGSNF